jgi:putative membrane protein
MHGYDSSGFHSTGTEVIEVRGSSWIGAIVRFVVSAIVLMVMGLVLPGFNVFGFVNALLAAIVIAALGWAIEAILGERVSPQSRGIVGFIVAAIVIYVAQYLVPGMSVSILGALLASLVVGIIDAFVPTVIR